MKEAVPPPSPRWNLLHRLFGLSKLPRNAPGTATIPIGTSKVPSKVLLSAKRALHWIAIVPGGNRAMANIDVALETVNEFNVTSTQDERMRRHLEYHVQCLIELLEPFSITRGHEISPPLQSQVLTLGRELFNASMKFKAVQPSDESPPRRSFFREQKRPNRPEVNAHSIGAFVQDFGLALDSYRVTALPMYGVSQIEVALHPLGIVSHSSCGLEPFLDGILNYMRVMEYRLGVVRSIQPYYKSPDLDYILIQLVNGRGVESWLRLGLDTPINSVSVSFATTEEALTRKMSKLSRSTAVEDPLPVTGFARQFKVLFNHANGENVKRGECKEISLYHIIGHVLPQWTVDEDFLLQLHFKRYH